MEVEYTLTPADFVAFSHYHSDHSAAGRWLFRRGLIVVPFLLMALLVIYVHRDQNGDIDWNDPELWIAVVGLLVPPVAGIALRKRVNALVIRWLLRRPGNAKLLEPQRLEVMPQGFVQTTKISSSTILWSGVVKIAITRDHLFVYLLTASAIVVPRRAFAEEHEFGEFARTAEQLYEEATGASARVVPESTDAG